MISSYHGFEIEEFDELDSTNTKLVSLAKAGERSGKVIIAGTQTAGRGRQGRSFFSPGSTGLYMSVLIRKPIKVSDAVLLTPAAAVAVSSVLEKISGKKMGIKWVNDIFTDGKKLCGILTETKFDFEKERLDYAVIGIGVNLCAPESGFPDEIEAVAAALFDARPSDEIREKIVLNILDALNEAVNQLGSREFLSDYRRRSVLIGKTVSVLTPQGSYNAVAVDIDDTARLVVKTFDGGIKALDSGEIRAKLT